MAYAVIDFETTGLVPERGDRIVEVAIVLVDAFGNVERDWTTLVNPKRDVGATHIHGLTAGELLDAPEFDDIADDILDLVAGRAVVAHNAIFDMRFLQSELTRVGHRIDRPPALCSMKWSGRLVGPAKLSHACEAIGISVVNAHSALGDARATAGLLAYLMRRAHNQNEWNNDVHHSRSFAWPASLGERSAEPVVRGERKSEPAAWLGTVLGAAWIPGVPEDEASYLLILERALLDRHISRTEAQQLVETARKSKLSGVTIARLHRDYLRSIAQEAWADGVLTSEERADLQAVADALQLPDTEVTEALARVRERPPADKSNASFLLSVGDRVVFTGETSRSRDDWVDAIVAAGLVSGGVTKSTKLVVAADPDSLSGKAAKARAYGIPIVGEEAFLRLFERYKQGQ